jgi:FixJ family two-component response regulator
MADKILFVDDEPSILDGYRRMLHKDFKLDTAVGGEDGLKLIKETGPYAVVVSDMRMPGMSGAEFLAQVRKMAPETVRMLLTGFASIDAAIEAVNEGNIFRFLTKPCEKEVLVHAINLGLELHHSMSAENLLIKKAHFIERATEDSNPVEVCDWDNGDSLTGLPGPSQARTRLAPLFRVDLQAYVVLLKITMLQTIEQRYGEEAAGDYLNFAAQYLMQSLRPEDRLFHWDRDVLMAVVRRQMPLAGLRMEMNRIARSSSGCVLDVNGKKIMTACSIAFDLLPVSQYPSINEMLKAFEGRAANPSLMV